MQNEMQRNKCKKKDDCVHAYRRFTNLRIISWSRLNATDLCTSPHTVVVTNLLPPSSQCLGNTLFHQLDRSSFVLPTHTHTYVGERTTGTTYVVRAAPGRTDSTLPRVRVLCRKGWTDDILNKVLSRDISTKIYQIFFFMREEEISKFPSSKRTTNTRTSQKLHMCSTEKTPSFEQTTITRI